MGLFKKKNPDGVDSKTQYKILYTSDVHGSEVTFKKFLNAGKMFKVDALIIGGDVAGKALIPIVELGNGKYDVQGTEVGREGLETLKQKIKNEGNYYVIVDKKGYDELNNDKRKVDEAFKTAMIERLREWVKIAEERYKGTNIPIYVNLGNDDPLYLFDILDEGTVTKKTEGFIIPLGKYEMISFGYVNPTPWNTPREMSEEELYSNMVKMIEKVSNPNLAIFNFHAPPYGTNLDNAPLLDKTLKPVVRGGEIVMTHVGSKAVRKTIEEFKPLMGIHGHIHESRGFDRVAGTLVLNPGSEYSSGIFHGVYIVLEGEKVKTHQFITG
ncbi:metallophosphoesterase family protein [Stygiolobus caldivivus]|uniref:Metallophosphoesterase n=1 Tax=Stygiolobus caldivivus TaxID=2824673 RepID=A0A8D5ZJI0_9CREN|nr:metallophosphoesterase [Stygiolobus caldivivus]BCU71609.1 metallophosphoesterase [Stygiolobus caldivivus]